MTDTMTESDATETRLWTTAHLLEATAGERVCGQPAGVYGEVGIDSRTIAASGVFVAIKGERHDGHRFIKEVIAKGVRAVILDRNRVSSAPLALWEQKGVTAVAVRDTTEALGDLAAFHRSRCRARLAAITGSNGKTTTREMAAAVLRQRYSVLTPKGNYNNEIGLPLTLLRLRPGHQWAVAELGMNHPGEIDRLARICKPDIGAIVNIGPAHLEGVGTVKGVMEAKGELLEHIAPQGSAVLNADDPYVKILAKRHPGRCLLYGRGRSLAVRGQDAAGVPAGVGFTLTIDDLSISVNLRTPGRFMVENALAAAAIGHLAGLTLTELKTGLEAFRPVGGRLNILHLPGGINLIDDTYNANPASMEAAVSTLVALKGKGRAAVAMGDMLELGEQSDHLHRSLGERIGRCDLNRLCATGEFSGRVIEGARASGMAASALMTGSKEEIFNNLVSWLRPGDWLLIKGSRGMAMEAIVQKLRAWADSSPVPTG